MSKITGIIRDIEQQQIGLTNRRVLLVEGVDDVQAIKAFLGKKFSNWESDWVVVDAGGKKNVLEIIKQKSDWVGVVDSDEWNQAVIEQQQQANNNLWVLPRYCIENYLLIPHELWAAFPIKQQVKVLGGLETLEQRMTDDLDKWVRHGVLWSIINPLWDGLCLLGFPKDLLNLDIVEDDLLIKDKLLRWHDFLEPDALYQSYQNKLAEVQLLSSEEQLKRWVHGKKFYNSKVNQVLNVLLGQIHGGDRQTAIFRTCQVPQDFASLWEKMGLAVVGSE